MDLRQFMILLACVVVIVWLVIGISALTTKEQIIKADSIRTDSVKTQVKPVDEYYSAADWNLPPGKIIAFEPDDESITILEISQQKELEIWVHIQPFEDGPIKVIQIPWKTWRNLGVGNILK